MAKARKFEDARQFDVEDKVEFLYDDPIQGDGKKHQGFIIGVQHKEDDQGIRHDYRYTVQFKDSRDEKGQREVSCLGSELRLV